MTKIIQIIRNLLKRHILDSILINTSPFTRFFIALSMCGAIFYNKPLALGLFTCLLILIIIAEPDTLKRHWPMFLLPLIASIILSLSLLVPNVASLKYITSMGMLIWKFVILILAAVLFEVLIPQQDFRRIVRVIPSKKIWVSTIAALRGSEIGGWAIFIVVKTIRSRSIFLRKSPKEWGDALLTGIIGHFSEFLNGFEVALRSRGIESSTYVSFKEIPKFNSIDILVILLTILGFLLLTLL